MGRRKLYFTAFLTSPLIALILVTPTFVVSGIKPYFFPIGVGMATLLIFLCWFINITILMRVKKNWAGRWQRAALSSAIMLVFGTVISLFVSPPVKIDRFQFDILRTINILAVNAVIFVIVDLIIVRESKKTLDEENSRLKLANLEAQYRLLMEKLNPHFLFNALGTAKSLIKSDPQKAETYLIELSGFLRSTIDKEKDIVHVSDELELAFQYMNLQKLRFGAALLIENKLSPEFNAYRVPFFSVLTLVENAVKHNALTPEKPLYLSIYNSGDWLVVKNNIQEKFVVQNSVKSGLRNLSERYRLLFNEEIQIENTGDFFQVSIKMSAR